MGIAFIDPISDFSLQDLVLERENLKPEDKLYQKYSLEIERRKQLSPLGQLLTISFAEAHTANRNCHVFVRKNNVTISIHKDDEDCQVTIRKDRAEQYIRDHGVDPCGPWVIQHNGLRR